MISNPFSAIGLPRQDLLFWADRHEFKEKFIQYLKIPDSQNVKTMVLTGEYGAGKTHALLFAKITCEQSTPPIPVVYISSPGGSYCELYRKIIETLGFDEIILTFDTLISKNKERILSAIEKVPTERQELRHVESLSTERIVKRSFPDIDSDLGIVLAQVYNDRNLDLCRSWLLGRELTKMEMGKLNVSKSIISDETAQDILGDILKILMSDRLQFILLIDEFEDVANLPRNDLVEYQKAFRMFLDQNIAGLKIILAWTYSSYLEFTEERGMFSSRKTYTALSDRLKYNMEQLKALEGKDLVDFLSDTIARTNTGPLKKCIEPKAIEYLEKNNSQWQPRQLNVVMNRAFELAISKKHFPINAALIKDALVQTGTKKGPSDKVA